MELLVGIFLPPIIDYFNKKIVTDEEKVLVTIIICFLVACAFDWNTIQQVTWNNLLSIFQLAMVLTGESMIVYKLYWKDSKVREILPGNGIGAS